MLGDDANNGTEAFPLKTLSACITRFGLKWSSNKNSPNEQLPQLVCALKGGIYKDEPSTPLDSADHLLVRPYDDDLVIFDGTDPYWDVSVGAAPHARRRDNRVGALHETAGSTGREATTSCAPTNRRLWTATTTPRPATARAGAVLRLEPRRRLGFR